MREDLLGIHNVIHRHRVVSENSATCKILSAADPGDLGRSVKHAVRYLAGHHVHLVRVSDGDQHIGVLGASLPQHGWMRCTAANGADIVPILQSSESICVGINERDIARLFNEILREAAAYLPSS